ncbi:hypothetical protein EDD90_5721 [Streptomyces sp. Ag109_O5-1]|uniref:hypothetical protein n=1 Tax=Streptomyces sp. Ag109_O5-1 TaxID=1938851 RepID=UPI000FB9F00C|nr:hypothetical protein [Streptomyces sp. Ag109_O5-1]RPE42580.1 hypothetical protein EDD90_5721 [Streptomyces sp. Ag109_O5-1]
MLLRRAPRTPSGHHPADTKAPAAVTVTSAATVTAVTSVTAVASVTVPAPPATGPTRPRSAAQGRWGAAAVFPLAGLCLVCSLTACGGNSGGYTAVGAAGGPTRTPARPTGSVTLVPLDGSRGPEGPEGSSTGTSNGSTGTADGSATTADASDSAGPRSTNSASGTALSPPSPSAPASRRTGSRPTAPNSPRPGTSSAPASPAALTWSAPTREATDRRWCEKVTVAFHNSGDTAVRSGTITLGTHIIDLLGIDWSTVRKTEALPVPIAPGSGTDRTWTVCVDDWRVPLGMHIETRVETVDWK